MHIDNVSEKIYIRIDPFYYDNLIIGILFQYSNFPRMRMQPKLLKTKDPNLISTHQEVKKNTVKCLISLKLELDHA